MAPHTRGRPRRENPEVNTPEPNLRNMPNPNLDQGNDGDNNGNPNVPNVNMAQVFERMVEAMEAMANNNNNPNPNPNLNPVVENDFALAKFLKFQPPEFYGKAEQEQEAELWIEKMEDIYSALQYADERKVNFAAFRLRGLAKDWWRRISERRQQEERPWSWIDFLDEFRREFIPRWIVEKREDEFQSLKQGSKTVGQYAADFTRLSKYCLRLINTEENKTRQFIKGLRGELQRALAPLPPMTYALAVEAATRTENHDIALKELKPTQSEQISEKKRKVFDAEQQTEVKKQQKRNQGKENTVECSFCHRKGHKESNCYTKNRQCYNCGKTGHFFDKCPIPRQQGQNSKGITGKGSEKDQKGKKPQVQARMYSLHAKEESDDK